MTGGWVRVSQLAAVHPGRRDELLARAVLELVLIRVMLALHGPQAAAIFYALRGGLVRIEDGDVAVWAGEP